MFYPVHHRMLLGEGAKIGMKIMLSDKSLPSSPPRVIHWLMPKLVLLQWLY